ncbi:hypothetical protein D7030_09755 [Flavobacteriaceae bacterium AU392]|nr:hypothetical protein D1817_07055 [Flavobacteriaceae bacterium]RKM83572.1 hypothetical protein D7030_09755 [Flavobacteriaceae bacterium AU392]
MKFIKSVFILVILILSTGCSITKYQKDGSVANKEFHYKTGFTTLKSVIILPVTVNGTTRNFLFDTGADLSLLQRDSIVGKTIKVNGASNRTIKTGKGYVKSIQIGDINFLNTYALNSDLKGLKEQITDFGGLIGQPIISKANWLIDYPNKNIEISNTHLVDDSYQSIKIKREDGAPYIYLTINGKKHKAIIDLGSSSTFSIPKGSKLASEVLNAHNFEDNEREIYTLGGIQKIKEKVGVLPSIKIESIEFKNVKTDVKPTSQLRIGNNFFKDHIIYIDNINGDYKVKKIQ